MPNPLPLLLCGAILATAGIAHAAADRSPEAQLARATEGRVAGQPVDCLNLRDIRSTRIINRTAIIYDTGGGKIYVNTPRSGASSLRDGDILLTDTHSPQLCSIDIVRLYDNSAKMQTGSVGLGQFVPYTRADRGATE